MSESDGAELSTSALQTFALIGHFVAIQHTSQRNQSESFVLRSARFKYGSRLPRCKQTTAFQHLLFTVAYRVRSRCHQIYRLDLPLDPSHYKMSSDKKRGHRRQKQVSEVTELISAPGLSQILLPNRRGQKIRKIVYKSFSINGAMSESLHY